ncbi:hypothetical protein E2C01_086442 [Portunus trituberculatus]|uniref:Uncharacterized protein n=1 Tax=Portunus trituberculatus TaxID=210409 RepID=A0A5B7JDH4_PORTR|nr:hypothetical protein [Portunus trituberculatus]
MKHQRHSFLSRECVRQVTHVMVYRGCHLRTSALHKLPRTQPRSWHSVDERVAMHSAYLERRHRCSTGSIACVSRACSRHQHLYASGALLLSLPLK